MVFFAAAPAVGQLVLQPALMLQLGKLFQHRAIQLGDGIAGALQHGAQAHIEIKGLQLLAQIADLRAVALFKEFVQLGPIGHFGLKVNFFQLLGPCAQALGLGQMLLAIFFVRRPCVLLHHIAHHLLKAELAHKVLHIQMNVQLGGQRQAAGGVAIGPGQAAHTQNKFDGAAAVAVFRNPQQRRKQPPGNFGHAVMANAGHTFQHQIAQQHGAADNVLAVGHFVHVGALDVQNALEAAYKIGALYGLERGDGLGILARQKALERACRAARKHKHSALHRVLAAVHGVFAVLHGGQEIPQPATADAAKLTVEFIKEHQRDLFGRALQRLMHGREQFAHRAVLGKIQRRNGIAPAAEGDLAHAKAFARARRAEHRHRNGLGVFPFGAMVVVINILIQQALDGVVVFDLVTVHRRKGAVAAHRHMAEQFAGAHQHNALGHSQIAAGLAFAIFIQNAEGRHPADQGFGAALGHTHTAHLAQLQLFIQALQHRIQRRIRGQSALFAAVGGEDQIPLAVLTFQNALLVEQHSHILAGVQRAQAIADGQLHQKCIHRVFIRNAAPNGIVQLAQMLHLQQGDLIPAKANAHGLVGTILHIRSFRFHGMGSFLMALPHSACPDGLRFVFAFCGRCLIFRDL